MKSLRILLFLLVGCFGPVEPPAPRCVVPDTTPTDTRPLELGDTDVGSFRLYADDRVLPLIRGSQGGSHINVGFRFPAMATDGTEERCMAVTYQSVNALSPESPTLVERAFEFERELDYWVSNGAIRDASVSGAATLTVTVVDELFTGSTSIRVVASNAPAIVPASLRLTSSSFAAGEPLPDRHRSPSIGMDVSPPLEWSAGPAGTQSYAVTMIVPGIVGEFLEWTIYDIAGNSLPEGIPEGYDVLSGARQGRLTVGGGQHGYGGGGSNGQAMFTVHALDVAFLPGIDMDTRGNDILPLIEEYTIATGSLRAGEPW